MVLGKLNVGVASSGLSTEGTITNVEPGTMADIPHSSFEALSSGIEERDES